MKKVILVILLLLLTSYAYAGTRVETQNIVYSNAFVMSYGTNESTVWQFGILILQ